MGAFGPVGFPERLTGDRATEHYVAIIESSDDAILSKDLNGVIMTWNRGAQLLFGYTAEEAVGRPVTILIPMDRQDEEPFILERVRRGEKVDHYETIRQRKDGSLVDISLTVSPIRNEKGEIVGASKIARDITESKRAQAQQELLLREMDHRVKNLFTLAISVLTLSGRYASSVPQLIDSTRVDFQPLGPCAGARFNFLSRYPRAPPRRKTGNAAFSPSRGDYRSLSPRRGRRSPIFRSLVAIWRFRGHGRSPASRYCCTSSRQIPCKVWGVFLDCRANRSPVRGPSWKGGHHLV